MGDFILNAVKKEVNKCGHQDEQRLYRSLIQQTGFWRSELKTYLECYFTQTPLQRGSPVGCRASLVSAGLSPPFPALIRSNLALAREEGSSTSQAIRTSHTRVLHWSMCEAWGISHLPWLIPASPFCWRKQSSTKLVQPYGEGTSLHPAIHMTSSREEPNPWQYEALNSTLTCTSWGRCTLPHIIHLCVVQSHLRDKEDLSSFLPTTSSLSLTKIHRLSLELHSLSCPQTSATEILQHPRRPSAAAPECHSTPTDLITTTQLLTHPTHVILFWQSSFNFSLS